MLNYDYKPEFIVDKYNPLTLHRTVLEKAQHLEGGLKEEFADLISCIARSCKLINYHLRKPAYPISTGTKKGTTQRTHLERRERKLMLSVMIFSSNS